MNKRIRDLINNNSFYPEVIAFVGPIGSGKSFRASQLVKDGYTEVAFADYLRELAWQILGWEPLNDKEYDEFKKGKIRVGVFGNINGRIFLQNLGQAMRNKDEDFWVNSLKARIDKMQKMGYNKFIITDLRYENEVRFVKSFDNSKIVFCNYKSDRYDATNSHESEKLAQKLLAQGYKDGDII